MVVGVVHGLEAVEVEDHEDQRLDRRAPIAQRDGEKAVHRLAVGQSGQWIVMGQVMELLPLALSLHLDDPGVDGNVSELGQHARHLAQLVAPSLQRHDARQVAPVEATDYPDHRAHRCGDRQRGESADQQHHQTGPERAEDEVAGERAGIPLDAAGGAAEIPERPRRQAPLNNRK